MASEHGRTTGASNDPKSVYYLFYIYLMNGSHCELSKVAAI